MKRFWQRDTHDLTSVVYVHTCVVIDFESV
jgi:hypothetical protein